MPKTSINPSFTTMHGQFEALESFQDRALCFAISLLVSSLKGICSLSPRAKDLSQAVSLMQSCHLLMQTHKSLVGQADLLPAVEEV
jgi:hypothetical protein